MAEWLDNAEAFTFKGQLKVPYTWSVGEVGSRFLVSLRDDKKIVGNKCTACNTVYVPPRKNCAKCFKEINEWVDLRDEGTVSAYTIVRFDFPIQPVKAPFAYALIKLDSADVALLHIVKKDLEKLKNGVRVKAKFKEDRSGHILDIDSFTII